MTMFPIPLLLPVLTAALAHLNPELIAAGHTGLAWLLQHTKDYSAMDLIGVLRTLDWAWNKLREARNKRNQPPTSAADEEAKKLHA